jgi:hypothetical protein
MNAEPLSAREDSDMISCTATESAPSAATFSSSAPASSSGFSDSTVYTSDFADHPLYSSYGLEITSTQVARASTIASGPSLPALSPSSPLLPDAATSTAGARLRSPPTSSDSFALNRSAQPFTPACPSSPPSSVPLPARHLTPEHVSQDISTMLESTASHQHTNAAKRTVPARTDSEEEDVPPRPRKRSSKRRAPTPPESEDDAPPARHSRTSRALSSPLSTPPSNTRRRGVRQPVAPSPASPKAKSKPAARTKAKKTSAAKATTSGSRN